MRGGKVERESERKREKKRMGEKRDHPL